MSGKHTQGEMSYQDKRPHCNGFSLFVGDQYVGFISDSDLRTDWNANSERIAACWNACQGIDTADLKSGSVSIIHKLHDEAAKRVLAQRDELLAALKAVDGALREAWYAGTLPTSVIPAHVAQQCKSAIAKVEGGA